MSQFCWKASPVVRNRVGADRRNAYVFQINPLGTQRDALITDVQAGDTQCLGGGRRRPARMKAA